MKELNPAFSRDYIHTDEELQEIKNKLSDNGSRAMMWIIVSLMASFLIWVNYLSEFIPGIVFGILSVIIVFTSMYITEARFYKRNAKLLGRANVWQDSLNDLFSPLVEVSKCRNKDLCQELLNLSESDSSGIIKNYIEKVTEIREMRKGDYNICLYMYSSDIATKSTALAHEEYNQSCIKLHSL